MSDLRIAVLTVAREQPDMLRLWVDHYARQVGAENVIVFDDGSPAEALDGLPCTVHRLPGLPGETFERARIQLVNGVANGLLASYDYVIFVDADEFIVTDPARHATIGDLLDARGRPETLGVVGLNVVHVSDREAPLDLTRPILDQRSFAVFTPLMCKPSVKRVPAGWAAGSHALRAPYEVDPELFMIHLKFADRERLAEVAAARNAASRADGRAKRSSWGKSSDDVLAVFDRAIKKAKPEKAPEFDAGTARLDKVVRRIDDVYRPPKQGQLHALRDEPVVRIPARLRGTL